MDAKQPDNYPSLARLDTCDKSELRPTFASIIGSEAPPLASAAFLRGNIAWALQAKMAGKSPSALREKLIHRLTGKSCNKVSCKPGTRLIREWQGQTYEVTVLEKGFRWQDRRYNSLSRIAEEITGTRWSGPRFFGLQASNR